MSASTMPPWEPANCGGGKRIWFLIRGEHCLPVRERYHYDRRGELIRYASYETALRAATWLNRTTAAEDNCAHVRALLTERDPAFAAVLDDVAARLMTGVS